MKKWLFLFLLADMIFIGLVLRISTQNQRNIANDNDPFYFELQEGQKNKYDFVKSFQFSIDNDKLTLRTNRLQALCQTADRIELVFKAVNIAYAGVHPTISRWYFCEAIKRDFSNETMTTSIKDFIAVQKDKNLKLDDGEMKAERVYSDEDFPEDWTLSEMIVTGESTFTINSAELEKVHPDHRFDFNLSTFLR